VSDETYQRWRAAPASRGHFEPWYDEVNPGLLLQIYRMTGGNLSLAEDLLHDVVLRFLERNDVEKLPSDSAARAYLFTAARNRFRDHLRRTRTAPVSEPADVEPDHTTPADYLLLEERIVELNAALSAPELETLQRLIEGKTLSEIADEEGLSYSNAGVRVHRIRQRIRQMID